MVPKAEYSIKYFKSIDCFITVAVENHVLWNRGSKNNKTENSSALKKIKIKKKNQPKLEFLQPLRIMIFAMPSCHPGLLFHLIPATVARPHCSLLPFDANSVVAGNRVFIFRSLEKAALWGRGQRTVG